MDCISIIDRYYKEEPALRQLLLIHSEAVARKAVSIARRHPELDADVAFIAEAALLHDIGIIRTDAPGILCHGTEPYIRHGILGAEMLRREGLERHARVCERHTGTGLTIHDITTQNLPLPHMDLVPETIEEQIICYADKFYSKSHPEREKTIEQAARSLEKAFSGKEVKLTKGVLSDPGLLGTVPGGSSVLLLEKLEKSTYAGIVSELNYLKGRDVAVKGLVLFE